MLLYFGSHRHAEQADAIPGGAFALVLLVSNPIFLIIEWELLNKWHPKERQPQLAKK
jgi:hypothetical protein